MANQYSSAFSPTSVPFCVPRPASECLARLSHSVGTVGLAPTLQRTRPDLVPERLERDGREETGVVLRMKHHRPVVRHRDGACAVGLRY
jgi:hypothetical protein